VKYRIELIPIGSYFFGSENRFLDNNNKVNYYAKSNKMPQQTSVLGMLRKEILIQDESFPFKEGIFNNYKKEDEIKLIGRPFVFNRNNDFGVIKSISPVILKKDKTYYTQAPHNSKFSLKKEKGKSQVYGIKDFIPYIKDWNPKSSEQIFYGTDEQEIKSNDIFMPTIKMGINKDRNDTDDNKLYKQLFYNLKEKYSFCFFADIDFNLSDSIVYLGGESSSFKMKVEKTDDDFNSLLITGKETQARITLLGHAYVDPEVLTLCDFVKSSIIPFRSINMENGSFRKRNNKSELLEAGSILYFSSERREEVEKLLLNKNLNRIGLNVFR